MSFANGLYTMRDAYEITTFGVAKSVFASSWNVSQLAQFVYINEIIDGSATKTYMRRAHGDFTKINYIRPGQPIIPTKDPHVVEARATLRRAVEQVKVATHLRQNFNNAAFIPTNSPFGGNPDPLWLNAHLKIGDMARGAWETAITGRYIDTCAIAPEGKLLPTFIDGAIDPGPTNDWVRGRGMLRYIAGTKSVDYKAPGDADYGPAKAGIATGDLITLRAGHTDAWITFKVGTLPGADASSELIFSSTSERPDGLISLMEREQIIALPQPTAIDFKHLRALLNKLNPAYRDSAVFIMHSEQFAALETMALSLGGAILTTESFGTREAEVPNQLANMGLRKIPTWQGHPLLQNDNIPIMVVDGKPTHAVICVCLDPNVREAGSMEPGAFVGIVRGTPGGPGAGPVWEGYGMGWNIDYLGKDPGSDNDLGRITLVHGWALGSSGAAAMMTGFYDPGY